MVKDKPKVEFYGKGMSIPRAKIFSLELKLGLVSIITTEEDLQDYSKWKEIRENRNTLSKKLVKEVTYKNLTEKDYLIEMLNDKIIKTKREIIDFENKEKNKKYCEKHGHIEKEGSDYCARCGTAYKPDPCGPIINPFTIPK
jgi:hypothetical protein